MTGRISSAICVSIVLTLCASPVLRAGGARGARVFEVIRQTDDSLVVEYRPTPKGFEEVLIDSVRYARFTGASANDPAGAPMLPVDVFSVGIPQGARVEVRLVHTLVSTSTGEPVAPIPALSVSDSGDVKETFAKNPALYSQNTFYPSTNAVVGREYGFRGQRIVPILLRPVRYNPVARSYERLMKATVAIRYVYPGTGRAHVRTTVTDDRAADRLLRNILVNYEQAKRWRSYPTAVRGVAQDSTRDWFRTGKTYVRIPIAADGWYSVKPTDLAAAGVMPQSVDWSSLVLWVRGKQEPYVVRGDSSIEFYAVHNSNDTAYYDFYTDTNVCWLAWGEPGAVRFGQIPQNSGTAGTTLQNGWVTRHFEMNTQFYVGTGTVELGSNAPVPGRGWVWDYFYPWNPPTLFPFVLDALDAVDYATANLRVRVFSTTLATSKAKVWINDSLAGTIYIPPREGVVFAPTIPAAWLRNGPNTISIKSDTSTSLPNQFYLDWFEVDYGRYNQAQANQLLLSSKAGAGLAAITVGGFTSPVIDVFDIPTRRMITGGAVTGDSVAGYSITFVDSIATAHRYVIVARASGLPVPPCASKTFRDIRMNAAGADYLIVTHAAFMPEAQQLAAHRRSMNGVRTAVIDVQDIYDEFNYGVFNGEKIKDFLRYAYFSWPGARPAYLLMFGDASWDYHHYMSTTIKTNYVPAYGVPAGDNWFVSFSANPDSDFIPSMFVGRLPVSSAAEAQAVLAKVIGYDTYPVSEWNKNFLYITGGDTPSEQAQFDTLSEISIRTFVDPPPFGGTPFRVYKTGPAVIDGGSKQYMKDLVRDGLVFMNFLGHSGGRIWGVDIGPPSELENTDGKLPFVSSVSCNVGAFAEPSNNVLSEDFVLAPNCAAIAMWASSALGYPYQGSQLVDLFLEGAQQDTIRDFGTLTTLARIKLWQSTQNFIAKSDVNLTPLLGDPLSPFAMPRRPDLAITSGDIGLTRSTPTALDTTLELKVRVHNYGLVPPDSVVLSVTDIYNGRLSTILGNARIRPPYHRDSLLVNWKVLDQPGKHTVAVNLDPGGSVSEVSKTNNLSSVDLYIYANTITTIRPLRNEVVRSGPQRLVVSTPVGGDSTGFQYEFELDTVAQFDSPAKISSGSIVPGSVSGEWVTPSLPVGRVYFWRARTRSGGTLGRWATSGFVTASSASALPMVRVREFAPQQFREDNLTQLSATDTGVVIAPRSPLFLYARSLGYRANANRDYYSILRLNDMVITGYWWHLGSGFMVLRVNEFTGGYDFRSFDVPDDPAQADSMKAFIDATPAGNYIGMSVIFDGATNVSEGLKVALESLGSTMIRSVVAGQSWAMIGRKGEPASALESLTNDSAVVSLQIPNYFSYGVGVVTSQLLPMPSHWHDLHWSVSATRGANDARMIVLGEKRSGDPDTLRSVPLDSATVSLTALDPVTADPKYVGFRLGAFLSTTDALSTPKLLEWWVDLEPPGDLAISKATVGTPGLSVTKGTTVSLPVTVYNLGYRAVDTVHIALSVYDVQNTLHPIAGGVLDTVTAGGSRTGSVAVSTAYLGGQVAMHASVSPPALVRELSQDNNVADYGFVVVGDQAAGVRFFADGTQLMEGDYISPTPTIVVGLPPEQGTPPGPRTTELYVDNVFVGSSTGKAAGVKKATSVIAGDPVFTPTLTDGTHELKVVVSQATLQGSIDSLQQRLMVQVLSESRILQVLNYPNPFALSTSFTFILTGVHPPEGVTIRVYTVAGRKIKEIEVPSSGLQIGFNRVSWDGRDNDGDEIANGYYLYQVQVRSNGKTDAVIGKLAKVR